MMRIKVHLLLKFVKTPYFRCLSKYHSRNILKLSERNLWADRFPASCLEFEKSVSSEVMTFYSGFDPTAPSLHVGNLLVINALLQCQRAGHDIIAVVGGATALIGDPSGKSYERPLLPEDKVMENAEKISASLKGIFDNHAEYIWDDDRSNRKLSSVSILNNAQWYKEVGLVGFLRDVGKHLRLGPLISRTSIQSRLNSGEGLSFTEFSYQMMQAYDWLYLFDNYGCKVQIGGKDQMGNIYSGHDLIKSARKKQVTGLTVPLVTSEEGNKYGKTAGSAIWIDPDLTSPLDFYQFFLRSKDSEVEKLLMYFTFYPVQDVKEIMKKHLTKPEARHAQQVLARKVTLLVHGEKGLNLALKATEILYHMKAEALHDITLEELETVFRNMPASMLILAPGTTVLKMAMDAKCFLYEEDAIRIISAGGFYINQARVDKPELVLIPGAHILPCGVTLARVGKRNYHLIKWLT